MHAQSEDSPGMPKVMANRITVHTQTGNWILPYWKEKAESNACRQQNAQLSRCVSLQRPGKDLATEKERLESAGRG